MCDEPKQIDEVNNKVDKMLAQIEALESSLNRELVAEEINRLPAATKIREMINARRQERTAKYFRVGVPCAVIQQVSVEEIRETWG